MTKIGYSNVLSVKIAGGALTETTERKLVSGWVDLGAGVPGAFELTFRDDARTVIGDTKAKIGAKVEVAAVNDGKGGHSPVITGEVTGLETEYDTRGNFTIIRGYDLGHRMLRQRRVVAYELQKASDIARDLAGKNNIPIESIDTTKTVYQFISQANITDWDFLCRLADENGMVMSLSPKGGFRFVKPDRAVGAPPVSTPSDKNTKVLKAKDDILRCRVAVTSADQVLRAEARGWDVSTARALVGRSSATSNPGIAIDTSPIDAVMPFGVATRVETDTPYDKQREVDSAADALAADITGSFAEVEVTARGNPDLLPGVPVALAKVGKPFEGKYTVTAARHSFHADRHYETLLTVSGRQWRSLYGLASGGTGPAARLPGVANAKVADVRDPLRQGRVRLTFPWLDDHYKSDWTRTAQFGGVKGSSLIAPDVDDEVLVAFDRGALDHPYVIGGLYNGRNKPLVEQDVEIPFDETTGKATRHTLGDRSGNRLVLFDHWTGRKKGVRLSTGDDKLTINMDSIETEITVDSRGSVTIKGSKSVSVSAGRDLSLKAGGRLSLKAGAELDIQALSINAVSKTDLVLRGQMATSLSGMVTNVTGATALTLTSPLTVAIGTTTVEMTGAVTIDGQIPVVV